MHNHHDARLPVTHLFQRSFFFVLGQAPRVNDLDKHLAFFFVQNDEPKAALGDPEFKWFSWTHKLSLANADVVNPLFSDFFSALLNRIMQISIICRDERLPYRRTAAPKCDQSSR